MEVLTIISEQVLITYLLGSCSYLPFIVSRVNNCSLCATHIHGSLNKVFQPPGLACCLSNLTSLTGGQHAFHWKALVHQTQESLLFNMPLLYLLILYLINFSFLKKASAVHGPPLHAEFSPKYSHNTLQPPLVIIGFWVVLPLRHGSQCSIPAI